MGRRMVGLIPGGRVEAENGPVELGPPTAKAAQHLSDAINETAGLLAPSSATVLRAAADRVEKEVADSLAGLSMSMSATGPPAWLAAVAWIRRFALLAMIVAPVWFYDAWRTDSSLVVPVLAFVLAVSVLIAGRTLGAAVGIRVARRAVDARTDEICDIFFQDVDRRVGVPVRMELRRRAGLVGAIVEYRMAREALRVSA